jgi:O-antigen/teichoic acid export membrane protein
VLVFSVAVNFILQLILIPALGITGAALATASAGITINIIYTWIVWRLFQMFPFDGSILTHVLFVGAMFFGIQIVPFMGSLTMDATIRSLIIISAFALWVYGFNLMPEVMEFFKKRKDGNN